MKLHLTACGITLAFTMAALAQEPAQIFTRPAVPEREALERLNLHMAWRVYVPTAGLRDGIFNLALIDNQVLVLSKSGAVTAYDLVTGARQWRTQVGEPYGITQPLEAEGRFAYAFSRGRRHVLVRATGNPPPPGEPIPLPFAHKVGINEEPVNWHGDYVYTVRNDQTLTAESMEFGFLAWRISLPGRVTRKPYATDPDLFVSVENSGLYRLDRATGDILWLNPEATRFVAVNPKFVYAMDRSGRLLVLDYVRGTRLSVFDTRDFVVPIGNDLTDRLFLASHDGLLVCLHDREYTRPLRQKNEQPPLPLKKKGAPTKASQDTPTPKDGDKTMPDKAMPEKPMSEK